MTGMWGADTSAMRSLAKNFTDASDRFDHIRQVLDEQVAQAAWSGRDASGFADQWATHRAALLAASVLLTESSQTIMANAEAQDGASAPDHTAAGGPAPGPMAVTNPIAGAMPVAAAGPAMEPSDPNATDYLGPEMQALRDSIPQDTSAEEVRAWWNTLTASQRENLVNAWPVDLYRLDGLPQSVKDALEGTGPYNRMDTVGFALDNWNNSDLDFFPWNCTNFVSHALEVGGMDHTGIWGYKGDLPWYEEGRGGLFDRIVKDTNVTDTWSNANSQHDMWVDSGHDPIRQSQAAAGDLVYFDFDPSDGDFDHAMIVRGVGPDGTLYLVGHEGQTRTKEIPPGSDGFEVFSPENMPEPVPRPSPGPAPKPPSR